MSLEEDVVRALAAHLHLKLHRAVAGIRNSLAASIEAAIVRSPEYSSLLGGRLQAELGVADPVSAMNRIIKAIQDGIQVLVDPVYATGTRLNGGLTIKVLRGDFSEVLDLDVASYRSEGGHQIDWLFWLLKSGDELIIGDYSFFPGGSKRSRTGLGVMARGGAWKVPAEFSGRENDNWLTRAMLSVGEEIPLILANQISAVL